MVMLKDAQKPIDKTADDGDYRSRDYCGPKAVDRQTQVELADDD